MSIKSFFATAPKPADAAAAAAATVPSKRYELRFSRSSKVVEWDDALFTDCRPSEAEDARDETIRSAKRYDCKEGDDDSLSFVLPEEAYDATYDSLAEANDTAKQLVELQLQTPLNCEIAKQEDVSNGDLPHGYQLPPADTAARESQKGIFTGSLPFFCDPYGADVWTVCLTTFTVRVVVEGDRSQPPWEAPAAAAGKKKATSSKPKQQPRSAAASSSSKASASKRTAVSKPRRSSKGGGACIVSVPGLSKKEVAALNKAARASAKRMAAADSDDDVPQFTMADLM